MQMSTTPQRSFYVPIWAVAKGYYRTRTDEHAVAMTRREIVEAIVEEEAVEQVLFVDTASGKVTDVTLKILGECVAYCDEASREPESDIGQKPSYWRDKLYTFEIVEKAASRPQLAVAS